MANYLLGAPQDYIPQVQSFHPDLNFYSNVLQNKQSQYDVAHNQINQAYGTLLNSPLTRDENITRRDKFFKMIEGDVKKISKLDLSQEHNVTAAMQAFQPLYNDKDLVNDMVWTKQYQNQEQIGNNMRTCVDPAKCGGSFRENGLKELQYRREEFKNASTDAARNMEAPRYVASADAPLKFMKAAKDAGFNVSVDRKSGGYIIHDTNGALLLNDSEGHPGVLPNYLLGLYKDDQKVMDYYKSEAYVARKDFAKSNAAEFGSETNAEAHYVSNVVMNHAKALEKQADNFDKVLSDLQNKKSVLEDKIKAKGGLVKGSDEESALNLLNQTIDSTAANKSYYDEVRQTVATAKNIKDPQQLLQRADHITAYGAFTNEINSVAREYALGTAKTESKADPYDLASYNSQLSLSRSLSEKAADLQIWKDKQDYEDAALYEKAAKLGIDPALLIAGGGASGGKGKDELKKLVERGATKSTEQSSEAKNVPTTQPAGAAVTKTVVERNDEIINKAALDYTGGALVYMTDVANAMKGRYDVLSRNTDEKSKRDAQSIVTQMQDMFRGTKFNVTKYLSGNESSDAITKMFGINTPKGLQGGVEIGKVYENALAVKNDPSRYSDWEQGLVDKAALKSKLDLDKQVLSQFTQMKRENGKTVKEAMMSENSSKVHGVLQQDKEDAKVEALIDDNGNIRDINSAANAYKYLAGKLYKQDPNAPRLQYFEGQLAAEDFKKYYEGLKKQYLEHAAHKSFAGKNDTPDEGGTYGVDEARSFVVNPGKDLAFDTKMGTSVVENIEKNLASSKFFTGSIADAAKIEDNPGLRNLATNLFTDYKSHLGETLTAAQRESAPSFTVTAQASPEIQSPNYSIMGIDVAKRLPTEATNYYTITPSVGWLKHSLGKKSDSNPGGYDPSVNYSFTAAVPAKADQSEFAQRTVLTPAQALMNHEGKTLTITNKNAGTITINKGSGGAYFMTGSVKAFDPETESYRNLPINNSKVPVKLNADGAWNYTNNYLNEYQKAQEAAEREWFKKTPEQKAAYLKTYHAG